MGLVLSRSEGLLDCSMDLFTNTRTTFPTKTIIAIITPIAIMRLTICIILVFLILNSKKQREYFRDPVTRITYKKWSTDDRANQFE